MDITQRFIDVYSTSDFSDISIIENDLNIISQSQRILTALSQIPSTRHMFTFTELETQDTSWDETQSQEISEWDIVPNPDYIISETVPYYWNETFEFSYISFVNQFPERWFEWGVPIEFELAWDWNPELFYEGNWITDWSFVDWTFPRVLLPSPWETTIVQIIIDDFVIEYNLTRAENP